MKKSRYTEEQIAFALKQAETGIPVAEVIRRMPRSRSAFIAAAPRAEIETHDTPTGTGRVPVT